MKRGILLVSAEDCDLGFIDDFLTNIPVMKKNQSELRSSISNRFYFVLYCCNYGCALRSCVEIFRYAIQLKPTPFGIIRPAITGPGYEFKKGYFLSMLEDCDLSPTQIRIIKTLKQSKYYACSPMLGFHPTHLLFKIMKIQKEIAGNPRRTMPLSKLCTLVHLSPAWMSLKFNEVTKISMQSFALKIRFCHALWQICASEKQIKQIAFEFGYKPSSFSERFNSIWATRPGMIRKQNNRSR